MFPYYSSRGWLLEKYSGLNFLEKTSWGNKPRPAATVFCWFSWQNRSNYLVYPHGNLTVYHVTYIFSTDPGLRKAVKKHSLLVSLEGVRNLHDMIKIRVWCLVPSGCKAKLYRHNGESVRLRKTLWCHHVRTPPHPDPFCSEFIKGLALLHHIVFSVRYGVCSLLTCCAWSLC